MDKNPADSSGDFHAGLRQILFKFLKTELESCLPAKVIAFDRNKNRATINPMIAKLTVEGSPLPRNQLASIPVFAAGGGNVVLSFNLNPGDLGWIIACDRDISDFLKSYSQSVPSTRRIYDFNNGLFVPDIMRGWVIDGEDQEAALLQTTDGTVKIAIHADKAVIKAPNIFCEGAVHLGGDDSAPAIARIGDLVSVGSGSSAGNWPIISGSSEHTAT